MDKLTRKMKSASLLACLLMLLFVTSIQVDAAVKAPKKECHAYCVMDAGSGQVLFGQDEDKVIYPASTTKLMTAIVCVENGDVNKKIKTEYDIVHGCTLGLYTIGVPSNTKFTFTDLLNISLITSAADATDSLAAGVFGSKKACVAKMQEKVKELGLKNTSFDNPDGSDIGAGFKETYSTAREMSLITRYAMTKPLIRDAVKKRSYTTSNGVITGNTTNWFIRGLTSYNRNRYTVIGSKSGTTNAAGHVFIATAVDDEGHEVICSFFGNVSKESTFKSIRSLFDYTFKQYDKGKLNLTRSNYDVRCSKDLGSVFTRYAALNCYPTGKTGLFKPNMAITRTELVKMVGAIDGLSENAVLKHFSVENKNETVTVARLAELIQEIYPDAISKEKADELLSDCKHVDQLTEEERAAYAIMKKNGLFVDASFNNAYQVVTRKQALLFADKFTNYKMTYAKKYPLSVDAFVKDAIMETISYVESTEASTETATTQEATESTKAAETTDTNLVPQINYVTLPAFTPLTVFNNNWMQMLNAQFAQQQSDSSSSTSLK